MAGTMTIDAEWGFVKCPLPKCLSAKTEERAAHLDKLFRTEQWKRMISTGDRWHAFCKAARLWIERHSRRGEEQPLMDDSAHTCPEASSVAQVSAVAQGSVDEASSPPLGVPDVAQVPALLQMSEDGDDIFEVGQMSLGPCSRSTHPKARHLRGHLPPPLPPFCVALLLLLWEKGGGVRIGDRACHH